MNVLDSLRDIAAKQPDATALLAPGRERVTHAEFVENVDAIAAQLASLGIDASSRVAVLLPSGAGTATLSLAIMGIATLVPLNPAYEEAELASLLPRLRVTQVITEHGRLAAVQGVASRSGAVAIPVDLSAGTVAGQFLMQAGEIQGAVKRSGGIALVLHTSGTTGLPKIVPLTHANLLSTARNVVSSLALSGSDTCLNMLPMFHVGGLIDLLLAPLLAGGAVACVPAMTAEAFVQGVAQFDPTWFQAVPTMLSDIVALARLRQLPPTKLRFIRSVSSPLSKTLHEAIERLFKVPVIEIYGMSETSGLLTSNPLPPGRRKIGSVGLPAGTEIQVIDAQGNRLPPERRGEVLVRSPGLMSGYESEPQENAAHWFGTWLRTGDEGYLDADGYLFLTGRFKELINRGGEKISPREIDDLVVQIAGVKEAASFALQHPTLGEEVGLAVVLHQGLDLSEQAILKYLEHRLAPYKRPRRVHFVSALPRLPSGKLDRKNVHLTIAAPEEAKARSPRTPMERKMLRIWKEVLGLETLSIDDDFFDLGGDSLKATALMLELEAHLKRPVEGSILIDHPTIAGMSAALEAEAPQVDAPEDDPVSAEIMRQIAGWRGSRGSNGLLVGRNSAGSLAPLFWGVTKEAEFSQLATHLPSDRPIYAMRTLSRTPLRTDANSNLLADKYADEILETGVGDPIMLGGFCQGGALAFLIAERLRRHGRAVELLLHDRFVPRPYDGPITFFWGLTGWLFAHEIERARQGWNRYHAGARTVVQLDVEHQRAYEDEFAPIFARVLEEQMQRIGAGGSAAESAQPLQPSLPQAIYRADISFWCPPLIRAGAKRTLKVKIRNTSPHVWEKTAESGIAVAANWANLDGFPVVEIDGYATLDKAVAPGGSEVIELEIMAPQRRVPMFLTVDLLEEGVGWFADRGSKSGRTMLWPIGRIGENARGGYLARRR